MASRFTSTILWFEYSRRGTRRRCLSQERLFRVCDAQQSSSCVAARVTSLPGRRVYCILRAVGGRQCFPLISLFSLSGTRHHVSRTTEDNGARSCSRDSGSDVCPIAPSGRCCQRLGPGKRSRLTPFAGVNSPPLPCTLSLTVTATADHAALWPGGTPSVVLRRWTRRCPLERPDRR